MGHRRRWQDGLPELHPVGAPDASTLPEISQEGRLPRLEAPRVRDQTLETSASLVL